MALQVHLHVSQVLYTVAIFASAPHIALDHLEFTLVQHVIFACPILLHHPLLRHIMLVQHCAFTCLRDLERVEKGADVGAHLRNALVALRDLLQLLVDRLRWFTHLIEFLLYRI